MHANLKCNFLTVGWFMTAMAIIPCGAVQIHVVTAPGTAAPPATLGGYSMQAFPAEVRSELAMVTDVAAPGGGTLGFDNPVELEFVGSVWSSWSHGYTGPVYYSLTNELSLMLPAGTQAFYMYVEPNLKDFFEFTFTSGGASAILNINGNAMAQYVGVYIDDPAASLNGVSILQTTDTSDGFAVGEFATNTNGHVPDGGSSIALLGLGLTVAAGLRRRLHRARA